MGFSCVLLFIFLMKNIVIQNGDMVSRPGDSGSLWIDDANRAIALNFAGTSDGSIATANRFSVVMDTLNIDLAGRHPLQSPWPLSPRL
jgi:hypothetical protein